MTLDMRFFLHSTLQRNPTERWSAAKLKTHPFLRKVFPLDKYDPEEDLGSGSFGSVTSYRLKARERAEWKMVAVKRPKEGTNIVYDTRERTLLRMLTHRNIVSFHGTHRDKATGEMWLVMELCSKVTLKRLIEIRKKLLSQDAAFLIRQIVAAVKYIHDNCVMHR